MNPIAILESKPAGYRMPENDLAQLAGMTPPALRALLEKHTPPGARQRLIRERAERDATWSRLYLVASDLT